jgi:hypothetical protein
MGYPSSVATDVEPLIRKIGIISGRKQVGLELFPPSKKPTKGARKQQQIFAAMAYCQPTDASDLIPR